ncbi:hypothetical protein [Thermodesulfobacterium hydrogeniphilum]|uniref:hypothetical protein n=1 Tax=Thermodesulfobacterium hydrogeniphilum TaxID=161156 RepID=UPI0005711363|nr:hypothetical protein [Thermodesulfobacterium hydrogeniphilum]
MNWKHYLQKEFFLPFFLWILFSLRIYPSDLLKTFLESGKIFIGSGLYGLGMTIIANGLTAKIAKKHFSREYFIKIALWLAVITAISASLEFYFGLRR